MKNHPFKNFIAYAVDPTLLSRMQVELLKPVALNLTGDNANEALFEGNILKYQATDPIGACWRSNGFVPPLANNDLLIGEVERGTYLMAIQFNERILPGKVRDEHLAKRVAEIQEREDRVIYKKEYAQLRDEIEFDLLPKAFIRRSVVYVMFTQPGHLLVFTSSAKRADDVMVVLRAGIPALAGNGAYRLVRTANPVNGLLETVARSILDNDDSGISLEATDAAVLKGQNKRTIRIKDRDIYGEEIAKLLVAGYEPSELRLRMWDDSAELMEFTLNDKLFFKGVQFDDNSLDMAFLDAEDAASEFIGFSLLVAKEYPRLVDEVVSHLGGQLKVVVEGGPEDEDDEL